MCHQVCEIGLGIHFLIAKNPILYMKQVGYIVISISGILE